MSQAERDFIEASHGESQKQAAEKEARVKRELETAQRLAETEHARAEEQAQSARTLQRRAAFLAGALVVAALLAFAAFFFARQSNENANVAEENALLAQEGQALANTREAEALDEAQQRATAQALAEVERGRAEEEAGIRATAEAVAMRERESAEAQAALAASRELAAAAVFNLDEDPERSILLARQALSVTHTVEAEEALHQAVQSSRVRQTITKPGDIGVVWLTYHPDGNRLFTSGQNGGVMWDMTTEKVIFTQTVATIADNVPPDEVTELWINRADFSPDGSLLVLPNEAWAGDEALPGLISILAADSGREILTFQAHDSGIQDVTFNRQGTQFATTSLRGSVKIWDAPATLASGTGQELTSFCCHDDFVYSVNYSPDGSRVVTTSADETLKVWEVATGRELFSVNNFDPNDAVFTPDGQYLAVGDDKEIIIMEAASGEIQATAPGPGQNVIVLLFSPDGTRLAASSSDGDARIWNYDNGEIDPNPLLLSGHKSLVAGVSFTPDGRYLATGSDDGTARVWDISLDGGREFGTYAHDSGVIEVAFSPDGSWLASTSQDGTAKIWDTATREERFTLKEHEDWVIGVTIHPDGRTLATSSNDGTVRIWDAQTGEERLVIQAHEVNPGFFSGAKGIDYSADGGRLATGGADQVARVWDADTGEELFALTGHTGTINAVDYSPDGRWLITAGDDGLIKVWDPTDGRELWTLSGDGSTIYGASFSPDGSRLVAGHDNGQAVVWSFPGPEAVAETRPEKVLQFKHSPQWLGKGGFSPDGDLLAI
jgi:WD40 repeat protein